MVDIVLKAILLLSPIFFTTGIQLSQSSWTFYHLSCGLLVGASFFDKPKREVVFPELGLLAGLAVIQLFWHNFNSTIISSTINLFVGLFAIQIIALYSSVSDDLKKYMLWGGLINITMFAFQYNGYNPIMIMSEYGEPGGMMGSSPILAAYLTLTLPFAMSLHFLYGVLYVIACIVMGEILILPVFLIMVFGIYCHMNKVLLLLLIVAGIYLAWNHILQSLSIRWMVWGPTIDIIFNSPMKGYGLGVFRKVSNQFIPGQVYAENAFSSLIQFLFAMGFTGGAVLVLAIRNFCKNLSFTIEEVAIVALLLLSIFEYPFQVVRLWPTIIPIIAFYLITKKETLKWRK